MLTGERRIMGLHDNGGKGWKTISDLITAILKITNLFSAKEIKSAITEMHKNGYVFNDPSKGDVTLILCDKSRKSGYYFGLEGIQS